MLFLSHFINVMFVFKWKKNNNKNKQEFYLLESSVMQMNHIFNQVYYHCNIILILNINCRNMSEKWSQYWIITMYLLPISVQYLQFLSQDVSELCEGEVLRCNNKMKIWGWGAKPSRLGGGETTGQSQII